MYRFVLNTMDIEIGSGSGIWRIYQRLDHGSGRHITGISGIRLVSFLNLKIDGIYGNLV